jgi:hypothetical protein
MDRGRPATELLISKDEARRIAANIAKLLERKPALLFFRSFYQGACGAT